MTIEEVLGATPVDKLMSMSDDELVAEFAPYLKYTRPPDKVNHISRKAGEHLAEQNDAMPVKPRKNKTRMSTAEKLARQKADMLGIDPTELGLK